jgi:hypothetical protein
MSSMSENCAVENQNIFLLRDGFPFMERCGHKKNTRDMDSFKFSDLVQQDKEHGAGNVAKYLAVINGCINAMEGGLCQ